MDQGKIKRIKFPPFGNYHVAPPNINNLLFPNSVLKIPNCTYSHHANVVIFSVQFQSYHMYTYLKKGHGRIGKFWLDVQMWSKCNLDCLVAWTIKCECIQLAKNVFAGCTLKLHLCLECSLNLPNYTFENSITSSQYLYKHGFIHLHMCFT